MKHVLVIGSTVTDVIIHVDHLPKTSEDVHVIRQTMSLGGCAYNVSDMIRLFQIPYILFSPVGKGTYGHYVREALAEKGIISPIPTPEQENGCCYCFVEASGERTFVCHRGAEYRFRPEWFEQLDTDTIDSVYICGLEIEEPTGTHIVRFLEEHPALQVYFAPGPRILVLSQEILARIFALSPILHLNETEALEYTRKSTIEEAAHTPEHQKHRHCHPGRTGCLLRNRQPSRLHSRDQSRTNRYHRSRGLSYRYDHRTVKTGRIHGGSHPGRQPDRRSRGGKQRSTSFQGRVSGAGLLIFFMTTGLCAIFLAVTHSM